MNSSILSFPNRGSDGDYRYPGNCSGRVVEALIRRFDIRFVVDPMEGSGTTGDVCHRLGIRYRGFDLRTGFDAVETPLNEVLGGEQPDLVFLHPPYHDMITYSGRVWGSEPDTSDLSRCISVMEFGHRLGKAMRYCYEVLSTGGRLAVLVGDLRRQGTYTTLLPTVTDALDRSALEAVLIKAQHNTSSSRTEYSGSFIPICHEYLVIFRKREVRERRPMPVLPRRL